MKNIVKMAKGFSFSIIVFAVLLIFAEGKTFAGQPAQQPTCQTYPAYVKSLEVYNYAYSYATPTTPDPACDCYGYVGVEFRSCSDGTGAYDYGYILIGPNHGGYEALIEWAYMHYQTGLPVKTYWDCGTVWGSKKLCGFYQTK